MHDGGPNEYFPAPGNEQEPVSSEEADDFWNSDFGKALAKVDADMADERLHQQSHFQDPALDGTLALFGDDFTVGVGIGGVQEGFGGDAEGIAGGAFAVGNHLGFGGQSGENDTSEEQASGEEDIWDSSISTVSQARTYLAAHPFMQPNAVASTPGDVDVERAKILTHAKSLFSAILEDPPDAPSTWTSKEKTYLEGYQASGVAHIEDLLSTKVDLLRCQSQCLLVIEEALALHGPGIMPDSSTTMKLDSGLVLADRISHMINCAQIKPVGLKILRGDKGTISHLVQNPISLLKTRMSFAKNNSGKKVINEAGKQTLPTSTTTSRASRHGSRNASRQPLRSNFPPPPNTQTNTPSKLSTYWTPHHGSAGVDTYTSAQKHSRQASEDTIDPQLDSALRKRARTDPETTQHSHSQDLYQSSAMYDLHQQTLPGHVHQQKYSQPRPRYQTRPQTSNLQYPYSDSSLRAPELGLTSIASTMFTSPTGRAHLTGAHPASTGADHRFNQHQQSLQHPQMRGEPSHNSPYGAQGIGSGSSTGTYGPGGSNSGEDHDGEGEAYNDAVYPDAAFKPPQGPSKYHRS